jgi:hypothetical protein
MTSEEANQYRQERLTARSVKYRANIARLKAIRDETAATHCAHGVPFANCVEHRAARKADQGGEPA